MSDTNNKQSTPSPASPFKRIRIDKYENHVAEVVLNCPQRLNSMDLLFFSEMEQAITQLAKDPEVYVIIVWSEGKAFTAGLDLKSAMSILMPTPSSSSSDNGSGNGGTSGGAETELSPAVQNLDTFKKIRAMQTSFNVISKCKKPVIAAVQGSCIGAGIDMICACDVRLGTVDSTYSVRETQLAIVADLGTLQRIQKVVGKGMAREMAFTGGNYDASAMCKYGLLNSVHDTHEQCLTAARQTAENIARNSPLVVQATKYMLNYAEDHSTEDSLMHAALWNTAFIKSEDLTEAIMSFMEKRQPKFMNKL